MGRGLPKKYAKMGFKKGWAAFRASKRKRKSKSRRTPVRRTRTKLKSVRRMAKRKVRRRKTSSLKTKQLIGALGYAVIGEPVLDNLASKMGLNVSDDIVKGLAGWFVAQNTSGVLKSIGNSAMIIAAYKFGLSNFKGFGGNLFNTGATVTPISNNGATFA